MIFALWTLVPYLALNAGALVFSWKKAQAEGNLDDFRPRIPLILFNLGLLVLVTVVSLSILEPYIHTNWPSPLVFLGQLAFLVVVDDVIFYWFHRALHRNTALYNKIHRIHHRAYHPLPIEYIYVHPFEWLGGATGPAVGMSIVLLSTGGLNYWLFLTYGLFRALHEMEIHSTQHPFLTRLPFLAGIRHHQLHHYRPLRGNYASTFALWDRLMGTVAQEDPPRSPAKP